MAKFGILFFLLLGCIYAQKPAWYLTLPLQTDEIIGYGAAPTLEEAKKIALKDISQTLQVSVSASTDISNRLKDQSYTKAVHEQLKTTTAATLSGVTLKKSDHDDGLWYVALSYDNRALALRLKAALKGYTLTDEACGYVCQTELGSSLNRQMGVRLDYQLLREAGLWKLLYKDQRFVLKESEFTKLLSAHKNPKIALELNQSIYYPKDKMVFTLTPKDAGYLSLLYVENGGKVGILFANEKSGQTILYPPKNDENELTVANPQQKVLYEMYVAFISSKPLDLSAFESITDDYLDESNYKFAQLIKLFNSTPYSSRVIKIKY